MRALSIDLRQRIVSAYETGATNKKELSRRFGVSYGAVRNLLSLWKENGDVAPRYGNCMGRPRKIGDAEELRLRELVTHRPDMTLVELRDAAGLDCTPEAVHYALKRMGMSLKKRRSVPASRTGKTWRRDGEGGPVS